MAGWEILPGETPIDPSGLKIKGIITRAQLDAAELPGILDAIVKYLEVKPRLRPEKIDYWWSLKLHEEMFGALWSWAGKTRKINVTPGIPHQRVDQELTELFKDLQAWKELGVPLLEQAAWLQHRAVYIHPFENGNGRWSRLLANVWLKIHAHPITEWPEATFSGTTSVVRADYIQAVKAADYGEYEPLLELLRRYTPGHEQFGRPVTPPFTSPPSDTTLPES